MPPITAARSTLADGWTTTTKANSATAASATAIRGPTSAAVNSTAPHTMVTLAPDTAVRWVSPAARKSAVGLSRHRRGVAEHQRGQHRRLSAGSTVRAASAKPRADAVRGPLDRRRLTECRLARRRQHRDGQVASRRRADAGAEADRPARGQSANSAAEAKTTTRPDHFAAVECLQRCHGTSSGRRRVTRGTLVGRDDDGGDRAVALRRSDGGATRRRAARPRRRTRPRRRRRRRRRRQAPESGSRVAAATTPPPRRGRRAPTPRHGAIEPA